MNSSLFLCSVNSSENELITDRSQLFWDSLTFAECSSRWGSVYVKNSG